MKREICGVRIKRKEKKSIFTMIDFVLESKAAYFITYDIPKYEVANFLRIN